ncbi:hypothetical protein [Embleya sp. AB8]|uniref:hypothetical protein n=1 Tax=Embleya sp. AB8 TaxID=3156304 RepID=UPI003C787987
MTITNGGPESTGARLDPARGSVGTSVAVAGEAVGRLRPARRLPRPTVGRTRDGGEFLGGLA